MASCGMIYILSFMKTGTGIQAIFKFHLSNLKCCDLGITAGRDLWCTPLKRAQVVWHMFQVPGWSFQAFNYHHGYYCNNLRGCNIGITIEGIWVCHWDGCGKIKKPSFMKIGIGVQIILRFELKNLRGSNVGITNGRDLWIMPLRWEQVSWHKDWFSHSKLVGGDIYTDTQTAKWSHNPTFILFSK
jgi:hypothetical protein